MRSPSLRSELAFISLVSPSVGNCAWAGTASNVQLNASTAAARHPGRDPDPSRFLRLIMAV
jgi:hypothetical protein